MLDVYKEAAAQKKPSKQSKYQADDKSTIFELNDQDSPEEKKEDSGFKQNALQ